MYQALYRKYRPRVFGDVAGQEHITETLRRQIINDRLSHAYLFVGTRGTGKTTCAKILSRAVNCLAPEEGEPCNKCVSCIGIDEGSILDVLELDAASNNSVDNVRALRDEAVYSPAVVKKRVYIIDEVHMLSLSAFNALLKILEEPPVHILFILATTELHKVPATILSRCQKFLFKRLSQSILAGRLKSIAEREAFTLTGEAADKLAVLSDGSMRDAISLLDQCASGDTVDFSRVLDTLGLAGQQELMHLIDMIADRDTVSALTKLNELYDDGRDMAGLMNETASLIRDLLVFGLSPDSGLINASADRSALSALSLKLNPERAFFFLDILKNAIAALPRGGSSKLAVEMCIIKMCDERLSDDTHAIISRISRLETGSGALTDTVTREHAADTPELSATVNSTPKTEKTLSGDFRQEFMELLKNEPSVHALLGNSSKALIRQQENVLVISVADHFTAGSIESEFSDFIKKAASKALNRNMDIRVEIVEGIDDTEEPESFDNLSALGIVE